jgi:hypothetical protein
MKVIAEIRKHPKIDKKKAQEKSGQAGNFIND